MPIELLGFGPKIQYNTNIQHQPILDALVRSVTILRDTIVRSTEHKRRRLSNGKGEMRQLVISTEVQYL